MLKSGLKLSDPKLLLLSALGRSVGHCLVRVSPSVSPRLVVRFVCFPTCAGMSGLKLSNLSLAGLKLPGLSWIVWSGADAVRCELECLI